MRPTQNMTTINTPAAGPPPSSKIFITFDPKVGSDRRLILLVGNNRAHAAIPILAVFLCPLIIFGEVSPRHHWIGKIFIFLEPTVWLDCCLIQRVAYSHAHPSIYNSGVFCCPLFILFWWPAAYLTPPLNSKNIHIFWNNGLIGPLFDPTRS